jgi:uncharacterized protein (DUF1778 family)
MVGVVASAGIQLHWKKLRDRQRAWFYSMASDLTSEGRVDLVFSASEHSLVEQAAGVLGQSITDFTASAAVATAKQVISTCAPTILSPRDWQRFLEVVNDEAAQPNAALKAAADEYKKHFG